MLETLLTLIVLSSSPTGTSDSITPGSENYGLELAFEQAQVESMDAASALPLELLAADERIDEAVQAHGRGDKHGKDLALDAYGKTLTILADDAMSADGLDDEALVAELDKRLKGHGDKGKNLQDDGGETGEGDVCSRDDHPVALKIAEAFGMSYGDVMARFCAEGEAKLGFGQIMMASRIAAETGLSVDDVLALRAEGKGWGQIKKDLGVIGKGKKDQKRASNGNKNGNGNGNASDDDAGTGNGNGNGNANGNGNGGGNGNGNGNSNGNGNAGDDDAGEDDGDDQDEDEDDQGDDDDQGEDDGGETPTQEPTAEPTEAPETDA